VKEKRCSKEKEKRRRTTNATLLSFTEKEEEKAGSSSSRVTPFCGSKGRPGGSQEKEGRRKDRADLTIFYQREGGKKGVDLVRIDAERMDKL